MRRTAFQSVAIFQGRPIAQIGIYRTEKEAKEAGCNMPTRVRPVEVAIDYFEKPRPVKG